MSDGQVTLKTEPAEEQSETGEPLTIVGVGASAGGLSALKALLSNIQPPTGMAFVVVVHLSPEHESHLADLLQPYSRLPVQQVSDTMKIEPDSIYIIPPNANLNTVDTHLRLSKLEEKRVERAPIDHFFRTLAQTHDGHAIGVVLTGTGSDGTLGLRRIKERGGITIVQSPDEAEFDSMPRNAIASGAADVVLTIAEIVPYMLAVAQVNRHAKGSPAPQVASDDQERTLLKIFAHVRARTGHDFNEYKRSTIMRRVGRRMQLHQIEELEQYVELLRRDRDEVNHLFEDLLITVTEFFRNPEVFDVLAKQVVPEIFERNGPGERIRVWSVGCSTGEEAYSLAILLLEEAARRDVHPQLQIFASDLHQSSLKRAREGVYPNSIAADVSEERLKRYFLKEDGAYRVRKEVRELVVFAPHNLLKDPPFSHVDLVVCRNLLIYLRRGVQQDIIAMFHYALGLDGILVLGSSETIDSSDLFLCEDKQRCVYRRRNVPTRDPHVPVFPASVRLSLNREDSTDRSARVGSYGKIHAKMVEQYAPPSVLVTQRHDVVHYSAAAGRYLQLPGGEPTSNVFRLVKEPLRIELRALLHQAEEKRALVKSKPIRMEIDGEEQWVVLRARVADDPEKKDFLLVIFDEMGEAEPRPAATGPVDAASEGRVQEVEAEVELYRQRLQSLIEQYETTQEEMQASNEELQSTNEELRSTLEELETSKEELQSLNEELTTVNQENRHRVEELGQLSNDLQNLLAATEIATLFLDRELRIIRFTPRVSELFNIRRTDRGRPLADLTHRLGYRELKDDAAEVLERLVPTDREVQSEANSWFLARILPYRIENRIEGVVITFIDITARKQAESARRESEERLRLALSAARMGTWEWQVAADRHRRDANLNQMLGLAPVETVLAIHDFISHVHPEDRESLREQFEDSVAQGRSLNAEFRIVTPDGDIRWLRDQGDVFRAPAKDVTSMAGACVDVTDQKRMEDALRGSRDELEARVVERTAELTQSNEARFDLLRRLSAAQEEERLRLSRELHDQIGQLLTGLILNLRAAEDGLKNGMPAHEAVQRLAGLKGLVEAIGKEVHEVALRLRPTALDDLGLVAALRNYVEHWSARTSIEAEFYAGFEGRLPSEVETALYRVVQESLNNVLKHSQATRVSILLERRDGEAVAIVEDTGVGFITSSDEAKTRGRLGILGMQERLLAIGGEFEIESSPGSGTTVFARVPLSESNALDATREDPG